MLEGCRICAKVVNCTYATKLFESSQKNILEHFHLLTGILLENVQNMPESICENCHKDINQSIAFRERCISVQEYLKDQVKILLPFVETNEEQLSNDGELLSSDEQFSIHDQFSAFVIQTNESDLKYEPYIDDADCEYGDNLEDAKSRDIDHDKLYINKNNRASSADMKHEVQSDRSQDSFENVDREYYDEIQTHATGDTNKKDGVARKKKVKKGSKRPRFAVDWICEYCGKHFTCPSNFKVHIFRHSGNKNFQCGQCGAKFVTSTDFKTHMRTHTGERPHVCQFCASAFSDLSAKLKHERSHTNDRRFACTLCDKKFVTGPQLKFHLISHTQIRSFCCTVCDQWFLRRTHLVSHYRSKSHKQNEEKQKSIESVVNILDVEL